MIVAVAAVAAVSVVAVAAVVVVVLANAKCLNRLKCWRQEVLGKVSIEDKLDITNYMVRMQTTSYITLPPQHLLHQ